MTTAIFKSPVAIGIYIVATLGILAIIGYNFWGWMGGSDKWKAEHPDNAGGGNTPKDGTICKLSQVAGEADARDGIIKNGVCVPLTSGRYSNSSNQDSSERTIGGSIPINMQCIKMKANLDAMLAKANALQADAQNAYNYLHQFITSPPYAAFGAQEQISRCNSLPITKKHLCQNAVNDYNPKIAAWQSYMDLYRVAESDYNAKCLGGG